MRKARKIFGWVATLMLLIPLLFGAMAIRGQAEDNVVNGGHGGGGGSGTNKVTITLNKFAFDNVLPEEEQNDGDTNPHQGGTALSGVEFTMYDVTTEYNKLLAAKKNDAEATIKEMQENWSAYIDGNKGTSITTDKDGKAKFSNIDMINNNKYRVLMFVETDSPYDIIDGAVPMIVGFPVYKGDTNDIDTDIQLFPKNLKYTPTKKILNNQNPHTVDGYQVLDFEIGEKVEYQITSPIPMNIYKNNRLRIDEYKITDTMNKTGLELDLKSITVKAGETSLVIDDDYDIEQNDWANSWTVKLKLTKGSRPVRPNLTLINKLEGAASKTLMVTYSMKLTEKTVIDHLYENTASIEIKGTGKDSKPYEQDVSPAEVVATGGYNFKKVDATTRDMLLKGAKFYLMNEKGKYAQFMDKKNNSLTEYNANDAADINWIQDDADATAIVSTDEVFGISGLAYGEYKLVEFEAPTGYALPAEEQAKPSFEVRYMTFTSTKTKGSKEILNVKRGFLPATGGMGILLFLAAGSAMMSGAYVWYRKSKNQLEV
ncbi:SpaH/EbpB family LPXTG-anchored major pilin [Enterococcus sp. LJL120]